MSLKRTRGIQMTKTKTMTKMTSQKGFSLIEVMVSLVVVAIGLLSMINLQNRSINQSTIAYTQTQSTLLLEEMVEHLRVNKDAAINGDYNISLSSFSEVPTTKVTIAEQDRYSWFFQLNNLLVQAKGSINCDANSRCELEVQHTLMDETHNQKLAVIL